MFLGLILRLRRWGTRLFSLVKVAVLGFAKFTRSLLACLFWATSRSRIGVLSFCLRVLLGLPLAILSGLAWCACCLVSSLSCLCSVAKVVLVKFLNFCKGPLLCRCSALLRGFFNLLWALFSYLGKASLCLLCELGGYLKKWAICYAEKQKEEFKLVKAGLRRMPGDIYKDFLIFCKARKQELKGLTLAEVRALFSEYVSLLSFILSEVSYYFFELLWFLGYLLFGILIIS